MAILHLLPMAASSSFGTALADVPRRYRLLVVATHPVQYSAPVFRLLAKHPQIALRVAYCSLRGAEPSIDPEFGVTVQWDVPLLDGYEWIHVPNEGSGGESFWGLRNPGLWPLIRRGNFDAVICYTGYIRASFWISYLAARSSGAAFLFGTDATTLEPRDGRAWKRIVKRLFWPFLFRLAGQVIVPSSGGRDLMVSLGIPGDRVTLTPYAVDNDWWIERSRAVDRGAVRAAWGAAESHRVVLFCAKLQPWKRPLDLLRSFAQARLSDALLVFAGDGPLRPQLEEEAAALGVQDRVRFLGFVNQSQLPAIYTAADLLVLPSEYEPFAVVVNEAMCCGCPVIASDHVGAARDLVAPGVTGEIFPCGDTAALAGVLRRLLGSPDLLSSMGENARRRMETWSPRENISTTLEAVRTAVARKGRSSG